MNEDSKKTLLIGGISFLALSIVFRLLRGYIFSENVFGKFPWDNQLGVIFIVLGFIMFIVERWMNAPFFYGKSQKGGPILILFS